MAVEPRRGCGYRKAGGLYIVCDAVGHVCDRLPFKTEICPCCGEGIKPSRGWTWIRPAMMFEGDHGLLGELIGSPVGHNSCLCPKACPTCYPDLFEGRAGLLWIGEQYYPNVADFQSEVMKLGISRRLPRNAIPQDFELGKTWVLLGHRRAVTIEIPVLGEKTFIQVPGIFMVFKPSRIEMIVTERKSKDEEFMKSLDKRNITPVIVPDGDPDHDQETQESFFGECEEDEKFTSPDQGTHAEAV